MALSVGDREVRPLTAAEVLRMVELGILSEDERVELLHGVLTAVSPKSPAHATIVTRLVRWLDPVRNAERFEVRSEQPLLVPDTTSLPEPDIAVLVPGDYATRHPAGALLVVEVAVSSTRTDTTIKPPLYAAAKVPELWVLDVPMRRLLVFADPRGDAYTARTTISGDEAVRPSHVEVAPLDLAELLARL
jgi:Uma2 family endonuclease